MRRWQLSRKRITLPEREVLFVRQQCLRCKDSGKIKDCDPWLFGWPWSSLDGKCLKCAGTGTVLVKLSKMLEQEKSDARY